MPLHRKKDKFSQLLCDISNNLKEASAFFYDYKIKNGNDLKFFAERVKEHEAKGDSFVHTITRELNHTFITPIEREDIMQLAMMLDDVLDGLEETAARLHMYDITTPTKSMSDFVFLLNQCAIEIDQSIQLLANKKLTEIHEHAVKIKEYESNCDQLLREAVRDLFLTEKDPLKIIQYKEIYELLEEVADHCQAVANTLETVVMKNV
ncbi:MAG: DUF47 domain-containing protein [Caldibacillus debilis]|jgi:predicted phosphate transport protein (TIGR00153 family)|uniref:Phosphate transport regulator n=3 Tax=Caldibacillus debilis TaxID=301148 RepID=A0A420VHA1_9BACI|nr:DUF47 domain-containing protein [Caldibacillus debilis]MBO2483252.1 DUF47 domain-containing protein [Bacillaceae bacterium]KYD18416.1 hypothetical protein B4135_2356 [Caldibacillus debilis]MBY6271983.1 DUF47 domain-containing protein [Bacillaceae bacterium]REJ17252.1 MAG: DUF47 domain-containing protein [Caldibacillus debilis]REJ28329.1 MAG: DUF47 domain-containing protein [Caldibacillus debilis]